MYVVKYLSRSPPKSSPNGGSAPQSLSRAALHAEIASRLAGEVRRPWLSGLLVRWAERFVEREWGFVERLSSDESTSFARLVSSLGCEVANRITIENNDAGQLVIEVPLIALVRNSASLVQSIVKSLVGVSASDRTWHLGSSEAARVVKNLARASGLSEVEASQRPHRLKWPEASSKEGIALVEAYLAGTLVGELLLSKVALFISDAVRMEHCVITGGAGHGKTQTLQHLLSRDFDRPKGKEVGIVLIDSQGDLIGNVSRLKRFANNDRLLVLDPSDCEFPLALNLFDLGGPSLAGLSQRDREQSIAGMVQLYEYVIGGLFGSELTSKQSTVFGYLVRLMLSIEGATIHTLREVLEEPKNFIGDMERMGATARQFFLNEFMDRQFGDTRKQILRRLYGVLQNPAFERMFASSENRLDLHSALNEGRVVLCHTSREFLGEECRVFGRYCIAVTLKAAFDRARLPINERRYSYLYIDEASDYFDETVGQLLAQARKYRLGVVLAHQALEQMSDGLRAIVMSNTSVKLAGGVSAKDARALSGDLHTSPELILGQSKDGSGTRFATFIRNVTPEAVSWRVPFFTLEREPRMTDEEFAARLARNRREVSCGPVNASVLHYSAEGERDNRVASPPSSVIDAEFWETY